MYINFSSTAMATHPLSVRLGGFLAFVTGAAAVFPVLWTWQWNRKQPPE
jgi:hypothetical protein